MAKWYFDSEAHFPLIDNKDLKYFQSILIETGSVVFNHMNQNNLIDNKDLKYFQSILIETGSVVFNHMNQNKHTGDIFFSKTFIKKAVHISEWGLNPNKPMQLNFSRKNYNYWDYISSWKNAFYYQNKAEKHTWFIRVEPSLLNQDLPYWFYD